MIQSMCDRSVKSRSSVIVVDAVGTCHMSPVRIATCRCPRAVRQCNDAWGRQSIVTCLEMQSPQRCNRTRTVPTLRRPSIEATRQIFAGGCRRQTNILKSENDTHEFVAYFQKEMETKDGTISKLNDELTRREVRLHHRRTVHAVILAPVPDSEM